MKLYKCRDCDSEFEIQDFGKNRPDQCVDCDGGNLITLNTGRIEFDPEDGYDFGESEEEFLNLQEFTSREFERESLFDRFELEDEEVY